MKIQASTRAPNSPHSPEATTAPVVPLEWTAPRGMALMLALGLLAAFAGTARAQVAKEGDVAHEADLARTKHFTDPATAGAGVKVCVVADSIDDSSGSLSAAKNVSKAIPQDVDVLSGQAGTGTGEGLAMLEIIHKLAPGASLGFATGIGGETNMAANIRKLNSEKKCKIIVDDKIYPDEPVFQDGVGEISKAINEVTAAGVLYFSAAGNWGNKKQSTSAAWEGDFNDGGPSTVTTTGRMHKFPSGALFAKVTVATSLVSLHWSDPWNRLRSQYQIVVRDKDDGKLGELPSVTQAPPKQVLDVSGDPNRPYLAPGDKIYIIKGGTSPARYLHLNAYMGSLDVGTSGGTHGHGASEAAISVAAVKVPSPAAAFTTSNINVDSRSSDGGRRIFFKSDGTAITADNFLASGGRVLNKPDLAAATCVTTTLPGDLKNFCGTSAAAPHAAAIAALVLSKYPDMPPARMRYVLSQSALANGTGPWNENTGAGVVMASKALDEAKRIADQQHLIANGTTRLVLKPDGTLVDKRLSPAEKRNGTAPPSLTDVKKIALGRWHAAALRSDGTVAVWCARADRVTIERECHNEVLTVPPGLSDVVDIAAGVNFTVAVKRDGTVVGWGSPVEERNLRRGNASIVPFASTAGLADIQLVFAGSPLNKEGWSATKRDGSLLYLNRAGLLQPVPPLKNVIALEVTGTHKDFMALLSDGTVVSWTSQDDFLDGPSVDQITPIPGAVGITAIAAGMMHTVALKRDGTVMTWRCRFLCEDRGMGSVLTVPPGLTNVVAIAAYDYESMALTADGKIVRWGSIGADDADP
jgi:subtilisin family serine protease